MTADNRKHYAIELIESTLIGQDIASWGAVMKIPTKGAPLKTARALLPYCLKQVDDGCWLPLNREYKPLGLSGYGQFADYHDSKYFPLRMADDQIDRQWLHDGNYFFHAGNSPLSYWGATPGNRSLYLLRLWLTFRRLGMVRPDLPFASLKNAAKALGVPLEALP